MTPFKEVSTKSQLCKYRGGLLPNIKAFVRIHSSSKLQDLMQVAEIVKVMKEDKLKTTSNNPYNKNEDAPPKKETLFQKPRGNQKEFKAKTRFTRDQIEIFKKEGKCFGYGSGDGYKAAEAQRLNHLKEQKKPLALPKPLMGGVPNILRHSRDPEARQLCITWGKIRDHNALILFYSGAIDNFISDELSL